MIRVFIMELDGKRCCVNATDDQQAERYIEQGATEVDPAIVKDVFGDYAAMASPLNTDVDDDGNITFTQPDVTQDLAEYIARQIDAEMAQYDAALRRLGLMIRCAEPGEELDRLEGLYADWDAYAIQLMSMPEKAGYPWDGGGNGTPWPVRPVLPWDNSDQKNIG